jgi:hypothetical protein
MELHTAWLSDAVSLSHMVCRSGGGGVRSVGVRALRMWGLPSRSLASFCRGSSKSGLGGGGGIWGGGETSVTYSVVTRQQKLLSRALNQIRPP